MMRIGVIGVNHKLADVQLRELLAKSSYKHFLPCSKTFACLYCVLLSTCNRTEIYFYSSEELADTHAHILHAIRTDIGAACDFDQKFYTFFGSDCFQHLCRVTAGLDSAILLETDIQNQVKEAYARAKENCHLPSELHFLFQKALAIAKKVRSSLSIQGGMPSLEGAVFNSGMQLFKNSRELNILFVGASAINRKLITFFKNRGLHLLTLCNRTIETAESLASMFSLNTMSWDQLHRWSEYDWILFGTKASDHLINYNSASASPSDQKLIHDLSVPRNVDPLLAEVPNIMLKNIDQINHTLHYTHGIIQQAICQAEDLIAHATFRHLKNYDNKVVRLPTLAVNA